jgi:hypothetical protein
MVGDITLPGSELRAVKFAGFSESERLSTSVHDRSAIVHGCRHPDREWREIASGSPLAPSLAIVDKRENPKPAPIGVCPSCGLAAPDSPHASNALCIIALEAEVVRLSKMIAQLKQPRVDRQRPK